MLAEMLGLFLIYKALLTCQLACIQRTLSMAHLMVSAHFIIVTADASIQLIQGYAPNSRSVKTRLFELAVSFTALTAI